MFGSSAAPPPQDPPVLFVSSIPIGGGLGGDMLHLYRQAMIGNECIEREPAGKPALSLLNRCSVSIMISFLGGGGWGGFHLFLPFRMGVQP